MKLLTNDSDAWTKRESAQEELFIRKEEREKYVFIPSQHARGYLSKKNDVLTCR